MKKYIASFTVGVMTLAAFALPQIASASLIYDSTIHETGVGFGNAPRDLTLQATGQTDFESGSVTVTSSGQIAFGSPATVVHDSNGITNSSSTDAMPSPLADNQKYGIPTIGLLSITSANQIAILFNATEPAGNPINVTDLTLKFFNSTGGFLGAIDGQQNFANSFAGNGVAGFTFVVSGDEQAFVNSLLAIGGTGTKLALEASITGFSGGPESFLIYNRDIGAPNPPSVVPEPGTVALLGFGLIGFAATRRKSAKSNNA
jgi:hypothetical protein